MKKLFTLFVASFLCFAIQAQTTHNVSVTSNQFTPADLTIEVGDEVVWTNNGGSHNVNGTTTTYPDNPESFGNGSASSSSWTYSFTFNTAGDYDYQCDPHVGFGMVGTITVNEAVVNPPANDDVCDATEITLDGDAVTVDNTEATFSDVSGSCWAGTQGNGDVWLMFDFTPTTAENGVEISTVAGTSDDSRIALYTVAGCPDGPVEFTELACSEDISATDFMSFIDGVQLEAGTYYIQCGSWNGTEGSYDVAVNSVYVSDTCSTFLGGPWNDFNTAFGGAPVDSAGICPFNEITAFEIYASESYTVDNFSNGETYTFSMCNGSYGAWDAELSIWDADGNIVAFASDTCAITWTATYDGTYVIGINEVGACGAESDNTATNNGFPALTCEGATAVEDIDLANFSVFPNPNNGQFTIVNQGQAGNYSIEMIDVTGKVVYAEQIQLNGNDRTEISPDALNTGVYLVRMTNTEENYYRTIRMIVK